MRADRYQIRRQAPAPTAPRPSDYDLRERQTKALESIAESLRYIVAEGVATGRMLSE